MSTHIYINIFLLFPLDLPTTNLKFASIAIVSGYIVKIIQETVDCETCLSDVLTMDCNAPIFSLIKNQDRGGLTYPKQQFISVISIILDFIEEAIPFLKTTGVIKNLYDFIYPKLLNCPLWKCHLNDHHQNLCSCICNKIIPIILKNMAKNITDKANTKFWQHSLSRKFLKFT